MQIKCGIDIIEIARVQASIEDTNDKFIKRVYTNNEIAYCESKKNVKYQHYAARFAGKEAFFKAISECFPKYDISWQDIEIVNDINGRPQVKLLKNTIQNLESIDISLSHCKDYAIANVTVLFN